MLSADEIVKARARLETALTDARYKILVSIRPVAPARSAFNLTLQGIIDAKPDDSTVTMLKGLMFKD